MISEFLEYDSESGDVKWIKTTCNRVKVGSLAGSPNRKGGYLKTKVCGKFYFNHHIAFILSGIEIEKGMVVDHVNGNSLDNRMANLRLVTNQENMKNKRVGSNSTTGIVGLSIHPSGLYHAHIRVNGQRINLKYTNDKWEAICARMSANNKYEFHCNHGR